MKEEYGYLNDEELEALIMEVENNGMIAPPVYLKEQILNEIAKDGLKEKSGKGSAKMSMEKARVQLWIYSAKIMAAAAAAVFGLTIIPVDTGQAMELPENNRIERKIEKDMERYKQESEEILNESVYEEHGLADFIKNNKFFNNLIMNGGKEYE